MAGEATRFKAGQAANPEGRNQYTYRREAEKQLEEMLRERADGRTRSEEIIDRLLADAQKGKPYALKLCLERILPAVERHEHKFPDGVPVRDERFKTPTQHREHVRHLLEAPDGERLQ